MPGATVAELTVPPGRFEVAVPAAPPPDVRHTDVLERRRDLRVARVDFHDDVILVDGAVDDRYLALAESVVERVVDLGRRDAEPRGGVAIDDEIGLQPLLLLVGIDVREHGTVLERLDELRRPRVEILRIVGLQRVLIWRVALPAAGADVLNRIEKQAAAGNLRELRPQPRDHLHRSAAVACIGLSETNTEPVLIWPKPPPLPAPV